MRLWDYVNISEQIARTDAGCVMLHPASFVLFASALSAMECRRSWKAATGAPTNEEWDTIEALVDSAYKDLIVQEGCGEVAVTIPIGGIIVWACADIPENYLLCDGQDYDQATYPDLYDALAPAFQGEDFFVVPDLRDRFVYGKNDSRTLGYTGGDELHRLTVSEMPQHSHTVPFAVTGTYGGTVGRGSSSNPITISTSEVGSGNEHNNMPPFMSLNWIIRAL